MGVGWRDGEAMIALLLHPSLSSVFLCGRMQQDLALCYVCFTQALERGPAQMSPAPDEQAGPSGAGEQGAGEPDNIEVRGGRFSKSAEERQKMLKQRKEELLQQARRFVHPLTSYILLGAILILKYMNHSLLTHLL